MKTFWEISQKLNEEPMGMPPGGMGGPPGGMPGGGPPGMSMPPGGMGGPPMGGGLPGLGGPPGMGGPPMGGGGAAPMEPAKQIRPNTVWEILEKILNGKPIDDKKSSGQPKPDVLQATQPQQPPQQTPPPAPPGMAPSGPPAQQPPPRM